MILEVESDFVNGSMINARNTERDDSSPLNEVQSDQSMIKHEC